MKRRLFQLYSAEKLGLGFLKALLWSVNSGEVRPSLGTGMARRVAGVHVAGSPVLRNVSRAVMRSEISALGPCIARMTKLLQRFNGQGIAAPQVGENVRLFLLARGEGSKRPPLAVFNPQVLRQSRAQSIDWETCFSVPNYAALVSRPERVEVEYMTLEGKTTTGVLSGDLARCFQHELDHLDGVLYTTRCNPSSIAHVDELKSEQARAAIEREARRVVSGRGAAGPADENESA